MVNPMMRLMVVGEIGGLVPVDIVRRGVQAYGAPASAVGGDKIFFDVVADVKPGFARVFFFYKHKAFGLRFFRGEGFGNQYMLKAVVKEV